MSDNERSSRASVTAHRFIGQILAELEAHGVAVVTPGTGEESGLTIVQPPDWLHARDTEHYQAGWDAALAAVVAALDAEEWFCVDHDGAGCVTCAFARQLVELLVAGVRRTGEPSHPASSSAREEE